VRLLNIPLVYIAVVGQSSIMSQPRRLDTPVVRDRIAYTLSLVGITSKTYFNWKSKTRGSMTTKHHSTGLGYLKNHSCLVSRVARLAKNWVMALFNAEEGLIALNSGRDSENSVPRYHRRTFPLWVGEWPPLSCTRTKLSGKGVPGDFHQTSIYTTSGESPGRTLRSRPQDYSRCHKTFCDRTHCFIIGLHQCSVRG
jgi:hypothetical protein